MGRKLSLIEAETFTDANVSLPTGEAGLLPQQSLMLQTRIAEVLGLPLTDLRRSGHARTAAPEAADGTPMTELSMIRDCLDLIQAYTRITDPEERLRLLRLVRDAADQR